MASANGKRFCCFWPMGARSKRLWRWPGLGQSFHLQITFRTPSSSYNVPEARRDQHDASGHWEMRSSFVLVAGSPASAARVGRWFAGEPENLLFRSPVEASSGAASFPGIAIDQLDPPD